MRRTGRSLFGVRMLAVLTLLAVYLLTLGSVSWGDLAIGLALALVVERGWRRRVLRGGILGEAAKRPRARLHRALIAAPRLVLAVLWEITRGTWEVTKYSLGFREPVHAGTVAIQIEGISPAGLATWAFIVTVSPGELALDLDEERGILVIHALDASDPEAIRRHHQNFYAKYQREVIP